MSIKVLVVDDHEVMRLLCKLQLQENGVVPDCAESAADAIELFKQNRYSMILMDIGMPVMDGFEATTIIRGLEQEEQRPRSYIVALSGQSSRQECLKAGMDDYVQKPLKIADTARLVKKVIAAQSK